MESLKIFERKMRVKELRRKASELPDDRSIVSQMVVSGIIAVVCMVGIFLGVTYKDAIDQVHPAHITMIVLIIGSALMVWVGKNKVASTYRRIVRWTEDSIWWLLIKFFATVGAVIYLISIITR